MQSAILPMYLRVKSVTVGAVVGKPKVGKIQPIKEGKMFNKRLSVILAAVALLIAAAFTIKFDTTTPPSPSVVEANLVAPAQPNEPIPVTGPIERYFPGKQQDDLVTAAAAIDRHLPGKEKDDLVVTNNDTSNSFVDYNRMTGTHLPITGAAALDRAIDYSRMTGTYLPMQAH